MKFFYISLCFFLFFAQLVQAQCLVDSRRGNWENVGVANTRATVNTHNLSDFTQVIVDAYCYDYWDEMTGQWVQECYPSYTDYVQTIRNAITQLGATAAANNSQEVLVVPNGHYWLYSAIAMPSGVTLRGSGNNTVFHVAGGCGNNGFGIYGGLDGAFTATPCTLVDPTHIKVTLTNPTADQLSSYSNGLYGKTIDLYTYAEPNPNQYDRPVGDIVRISGAATGGAIVGEICTEMVHDPDIGFECLAWETVTQYEITYTLDKPWRFDIQPTIFQVLNPAVNVGLECFKVENEVDASGACSSNNFDFNYAINSWIQGVLSLDAFSDHVLLNGSRNISVTGCIFQGSNSDAIGNDGHHAYGAKLASHTSQCLIENNAFGTLRHALVIQIGANSNVISANYFSLMKGYNAATGISTTNGDAIFFHGGYPTANLVIWNDLHQANINKTAYKNDIGFTLTHGMNGPFNTFVRNRADSFNITEYDPTAEWDYSVSGSSLFTSFPANGNNCNFVQNNFNSFDNGDAGNKLVCGFESIFSQGYYTVAGRSSNPFSSFNPSNTTGAGKLPARTRYQNFKNGFTSNLTDCNGDDSGNGSGKYAMEELAEPVAPAPTESTTAIADATAETEEQDMLNTTHQLTHSLKVVPNPAQHEAIINLHVPSANSMLIVSVYNSMGMLVKRFANVSPQDALLLDTSNCTNGTYFVVVNDNQKIIQKTQFVVAH